MHSCGAARDRSRPWLSYIHFCVAADTLQFMIWMIWPVAAVGTATQKAVLPAVMVMLLWNVQRWFELPWQGFQMMMLVPEVQLPPFTSCRAGGRHMYRLPQECHWWTS
jgi:hypothetical protein